MQKLAAGTPLHEIASEVNHTVQMLLDFQRQRRTLAASMQALATLIPRRIFTRLSSCTPSPIRVRSESASTALCKRAA